ncbi:MAG: hypothetical protein FWG67_00845 [Defluviitaleaceae bacterium]|nr:hypothetical protein [Defluviitaleaceae bacterium]
MQGYYKNWYQHYLEVEAQEEKERKRGYYSNLETTTQHTIEHRKGERPQVETRMPPLTQPVISRKKKRKKAKRLGLMLPVSIFLGFIFLWYQMDIGPTRHLIDEALLFIGIQVGIQEQTVDVISYHTSLLDRHLAFSEKVTLYIYGEDELSFADLELMYDEIRRLHLQVVEVSGTAHEDVIQLWSFKLASVAQLMHDLLVEDDIERAHEQFMADQQEMAGLIKVELSLGEAL